MGIIDREYIAEFYSGNDNKIKDLSLLIGNDGFSFAIFSVDKVLLALREYRFSEKNRMEDCLGSINTDQLLKSIFRKVNIAIDSKSTALIPSGLYDQRYPERYLNHELVNASEEPEIIWIDEVEVIDGKNVHSLSVKLKDQLSGYFPGASFKHRNSVLIDGFGSSEKEEKAEQVYIHLNKNSCKTFFFKDAKLISSGEFEYRSPDDFLYYVLLVYQNHQLDTESVPLSISGKLSAKSMVFDKLFRYVRFINWSKPNKEINLGDYKNNYLVHRDYELFALLSCES